MRSCLKSSGSSTRSGGKNSLCSRTLQCQDLISLQCHPSQSNFMDSVMPLPWPLQQWSTSGPPEDACRLVVAKTRVAPLKMITIPKLELCGAAIMAELLAITGETLQVPSTQIYAWCDSTVVLAWLKGCPSNYKVFVANKVASASRNIPPSVWQHVPTGDNQADCASRGMSAQELKYHDLWWGGPPWLHQEPISTPPQPQASELAEHQDLEVRPMAVYAVTISPVSWWEHKFNC